MLGGVSLLGGVGGLIGVIAAAFVLTLVKTILMLRGVDQNSAQVIQGTLIILVVMVGGLAIRRKGKTGVPERSGAAAARRRRAAHCSRTTRRSSLTLVFVALYVATDIVNRAQAGEAFLTRRRLDDLPLRGAARR